MPESIILRLEQVKKKFASNSIAAVDSISFSLAKGELLGLLGSSGCGKTTLLRILAGFEKPSAGTVELGGKIVANSQVWVPPEQRQTGMVFQDYALFPHLNVAENVAFGLPKRQGRQQRVSEVLALVGLEELHKRYPHQLSGGQQQRVSLARALAPQPSLILLDEPLGNLDAQIRQHLRHEVRQILKASHTSAIFVTHDREEALAISDRVAVMRQGKIEQIGTPEAIYTQPSSRFVAEFVSGANFLPARKYGDRWKSEIGDWEIASNQANSENNSELMLRQEDLRLKPDETATAVIRERQFLGREYRYCVEISSGKKLYARTTTNTQLSEGTRVQLSIDPQALRFF